MKESRLSVLTAWLLFVATDLFTTRTRVMLLRFVRTESLSNVGDVTRTCPDTAAQSSIDPKIGTSFAINLSYRPQEYLQITLYFSYLMIGDSAELPVLATSGDPDNSCSARIQFLGDFF